MSAGYRGRYIPRNPLDQVEVGYFANVVNLRTGEATIYQIEKKYPDELHLVEFGDMADPRYEILLSKDGEYIMHGHDDRYRITFSPTLDQYIGIDSTPQRGSRLRQMAEQRASHLPLMGKRVSPSARRIQADKEPSRIRQMAEQRVSHLPLMGRRASVYARQPSTAQEVAPSASYVGNSLSDTQRRTRLSPPEPRDPTKDDDWAGIYRNIPERSELSDYPNDEYSIGTSHDQIPASLAGRMSRSPVSRRSLVRLPQVPIQARSGMTLPTLPLIDERQSVRFSDLGQPRSMSPRRAVLSQADIEELNNL